MPNVNYASMSLCISNNFRGQSLVIGLQKKEMVFEEPITFLVFLGMSIF